MKHILVPTDFSKNSYNALFYAINLFKDEVCTFYILHSFKVKTNPFTSRLNTEKGKLKYYNLLAKAEDQLAELVLNINTSVTKTNNHIYETLAITKPLEEIVPKTIKKKNIDLVIMGTKGATGAKEILFGSNAVKIIKLLHNTPLLLVPKETNTTTLNNIVFATAFKKSYTNKALKALKIFLELTDSSIKVLSVLDTEKLSGIQEKNKEQLEESIKETSHNYHIVQKSKSIEKHIHEFVKNIEYGILSMIKYEHDDFYKITHDATINKLGYHLEKPFLIIPE